MIVIPFIIALTLVAVYLGNLIRKNNKMLYLIATVISIATFLLRYKIPIVQPFTQGYLGLAFLYIVMVAGAFKDKSFMNKRLLGVRKEYSIIGFIFLIPHALKYLFEFFDGLRTFEWLGVIPFVIMIPLFITSFIYFRKKIKPTTWKNLQRFAYLAYILIYVHLIIVADLIPTIIYSVLFIPYIILKLYKEIKILKKAS